MLNVKWRQQAPFGRYVFDFVSHEVKIVVELDGAGHAFRSEYDHARKSWIESRGYLVPRFGSNIRVSSGDEIVERTAAEVERRRPGSSQRIESPRLD